MPWGQRASVTGPGRPGDRNLSALPARLWPSSNPRARGRGADMPGKLTEAPERQLRVPGLRGSGLTPSSGEVLTFLSWFIPESQPLTSEQCPGSGSQQGRAPGDSLVHGSPGHPQTQGGSRQAEWGDKSGAREQGCEEEPRDGACPRPKLHRPPACRRPRGPGCEPPSLSPLSSGKRGQPGPESPVQLCSRVTLTIPPPSLGIWQGFPMTSQETGAGRA